MRSRRRIVGWGAAAALVYVAVALATFGPLGVPVRPLYDGVHDPGGLPYRWVDPPPEEEPFNLPPESGIGEIELTRQGSRDDDFRTLDLQAGIVFPPQAFGSQEGERRIVVTLEPVDPQALGPPPEGLEYQGNAYEITARYKRSEEPAPPLADECDPRARVYRCMTLILRTPFGSSGLYRMTDDGWTELPDTVEAQTDRFGDTPALGTFVAMGPEGTIAAGIAAREGGSGGVSTSDIMAIVLGAVAAIGGTLVFRWRAGKRSKPKRPVHRTKVKAPAGRRRR